jgi:UDP-GlcNAc:undecaprenyl-phosphate GlcNAc-1-phosphate transferase
MLTPDLSILLPILVLAALGWAAALTPLVRMLAIRAKAIDKPTGGRKIHRTATPLWGGLATGGAIILSSLALLPFVDGQELRAFQLVGFCVAIVVLMVGGALDDRFDLPPLVQFFFPLVASLIVVGTGSGIVQVSNPLGHGAMSLVWRQTVLGSFTISLPADLLTVLWLLTVTYAMKFLDGLDGLVAGMTAIGGGMIAVLAASPAYFQPLVASLALFVSAAHLGFLGWNRQRTIFLGEAGSTIAGFSLAVLAVISGAKLATAGTALAIPLVDIVLVIGGRLLSGESPFKGDARHLHFRLLKTGMEPRAVVRLIWGIALTFGLVTLTLQTRGKLFLFAGLIVLVSVISVLAWANRKDRGSSM